MTRLCLCQRYINRRAKSSWPHSGSPVLDAFLLAARHRDRVLDAIADARDPDEARRSVAELLGIEEHTAAAVVELRLRSFSQSKVAEVQSERDALKRRLDQGPTWASVPE